MMDNKAKEIIDELNLIKHPEGGWYSETYRNKAEFTDGEKSRSLATVIYFMLTDNEISAFHRLASDEFWYFHEGDALDVHIFYEDGKYELKKLGPVDEFGTLPQLLLPAKSWFAAESSEKDSYTLISCSVHPGFDFEDFELAHKEELQAQFPEYKELISRLSV